MKKIDSLLIKSFIAPFIATFGIGLFVLIMQVLWVHLDKIVGKGAGMMVLVELLSYMSVSLIPTALPIAILISSVMVMGNMAEHYELASLKSAGVPLLRIMRPLIVFCIGVSILSFMCSNYIIPVANLKFKSRLYDLKKQKPMLSLEAGVFNDDFHNMVIHIGKKGDDNRTIHDVIVYDHNSYNNKKVSVTTAQKGEMFVSEDKRFFVMNLFEGTQYSETKINPEKQEDGKDKKAYPFVRTSFKELTKVFDLSEFDLKETDTQLFANNYTMLSAAQLSIAVDSIDKDLNRRWVKFENRFYRNYSPIKDSLIIIDLPKEDSSIPKEAFKKQKEKIKKTAEKVKKSTTQKSKSTTSKKKTAKKVNKKPTKKASAKKKKTTSKKAAPKHAQPNYTGNILKQNITKPITEYPTLLETFEEKEHLALMRRVSSSINALSNESHSSQISIDSKMESRVKHVFEKHNKYSLAVVCIIFLFIGAPMGAIIRKGGFGYPILVSIFFFVLFIVMGILFKKIAESHTLNAVLAAWLPSIILFPLGLLLTVRAMNDEKVVNWEKVRIYFEKLGGLFKKTTTN